MAIAKLSEITGKGKPIRRITGSADIPLNAKGREQAQDLATRGEFDRVYHAPRARHAETAQAVDPNSQPAAHLDPMRLGRHEGKPVESEKEKLNERFLKRPYVPAGKSEFSGEDGESPHQFRRRMISGDQKQADSLQPGEKVLNIASDRNLRMVDAWLKNGAPADRSIDTDRMAAKEDWSDTGDLFRVTPGGLKAIDSADEPGMYYARHGETDWNQSDTPRPDSETADALARPTFTRAPQTEPAYGRSVSISVPGEATKYPARYAVRELADLEPSHNPHNFEPNPAYEYTNDRDYNRGINGVRVIKNAAPGTFDPRFVTAESPTAEHGPPVIDANGNVLGGNSRTMALGRVYRRGGQDVEAYRRGIEQRAQQLGIGPAELKRFKRPVLVREIAGGIDAQKAITDFNKTAAAELTPEERAVSDGRRLSPQAIREIGGRLDDLGEEGTLAGALKGEDGVSLLNQLVKDGLLTEQERGGYLDDRGNLTPEFKARIGKALVGRLYDSPAEFRGTTPEMRAKLERIAPQILRVEGREGWDLTGRLREAVALAEDARAHKMTPEEKARQAVIWSEKRYTPEAIQIAKTLEKSPVRAAAAFRRYANDEALSRDGSQAAFFKPPTRDEAFADAFGGTRAAASGERGSIKAGDIPGFKGAYKFVDEDVVPAAKRVAAGLSEAKDDALKVVAPTARGDEAAYTGLSLRQRMAQFTRRYDQGFMRLKAARDFFNSRSKEDNYRFIDNLERGRDQGDENLNQIAQTFRNMMDQRRREVQALGEGALQKFYLNYFPHIFERPEKVPEFVERFFKNRSFEGAKSFLKHRDFPTFQEALDAGMKPVSDNPADLIMMKAREMDRYLLAHHTLRDLAENGIARRLLRTGEEDPRQMKLEEQPEGPFKKAWLVPTKADLPPNFVQIADPVGGGKWYAHEGAARVVNNFLSPGLRSRSGAARLLLGLNNVMNQSNLGLSAFHLRAVTISSMANRAGLGFVKAMQGKPAEAAWHVLSSPAAPFIDYLKGSQVLRDWFKPGSEGAPVAAITDALMKGGGRAGQPGEYSNRAVEAMMKRLRSGNWPGAVMHSPFAALEYMAKPLMENLVPRMKLGAFADIAQHEMDRLGPGASVEQTRAAMAKAWDHVENRLGEMTYDNLFWDRTFKDALHLMVRSVGWNLGDLREMSTAAGALKRIATGKGKEADPHGLGFVMGYAFTGAMIGALTQYLHTGQGPQELEDYFWPKREDGKRYVGAPYIKDTYQFARDLPGTLIHKTGPLVNTLAEMVTNKDYYDRPIRNLDDSAIQQLQQEAGFVLRQLLPFTLQEAAGPQSKRARQEAADEAAHPEHKVEHFLGVQPAPAQLQPGYKSRSDQRLSR